MERSKITLGKSYYDTVTGFEGVATARCEYITGCAHVQLEALVDDKPTEAWFDLTRLVPQGEKPEDVPGWESSRRTGGPATHPPRRSTPPVASSSEEAK